MNLKELKDNVDFTINNLNNYKKPEDISVLITLSETSVGARASSGIKYVGMGFDWEYGQFRIHPEKALVRQGKALNDIKPVYEHTPLNGGRKSYICNTCGRIVSKDDRYCKHCGQRLR